MFSAKLSPFYSSTFNSGNTLIQAYTAAGVPKFELITHRDGKKWYEVNTCNFKGFYF